MEKLKAVIYCDPPYKDTTGYSKNDFNYEEYYDWIRLKVREGHIVLCSEYQMPDDFVCIWQKGILNNLSTNKHVKPIEKLFIHESQIEIYKRSFPDAEI